MTQAMEELEWRRDFERKKVRTKTMVVEVREGARKLACTSRDISISGIFVETKDEVAVDSEVKLEIGAAKGSVGRLRISATVVHFTPGVGFGARFLDSDEKTRNAVSEFIARFPPDK